MLQWWWLACRSVGYYYWYCCKVITPFFKLTIPFGEQTPVLSTIRRSMVSLWLMSLQSNFVFFSGCFSCISRQVRLSVLYLLLTSLFFSEYSLCACIFCCQVTASSSFFSNVVLRLFSFKYLMWSSSSSTQGVVACTYVCFLAGSPFTFYLLLHW